MTSYHWYIIDGYLYYWFDSTSSTLAIAIELPMDLSHSNVDLDVNLT